MNEDAKSRFILMMALGITFFVILQFILPPEPQAPTVQPEPALEDNYSPAPAAAAPTSGTPVGQDVAEFNPENEYDIAVRVGEAAPGGNGYEANFSTMGAGMKSYRLLGHYRQPKKEHVAGDEVILLDHLAKGRDSLRIDAVSFGTSQQEPPDTVGFGAFNYELIEYPEWAEIVPEPPASVKRGDKLVFRGVRGEWELFKTFTFPAGEGSPSFNINLDLQWRNLADTNRFLNYRISGPTGMLPDDDSSQFGIINFLTARQPMTTDRKSVV